MQRHTQNSIPQDGFGTDNKRTSDPVQPLADLRIIALKMSAHAALALFNCSVGRTLTYLEKTGFYRRMEKLGRTVELLNTNLIFSSKIIYSPTLYKSMLLISLFQSLNSKIPLKHIPMMSSIYTIY